jgi:hypothetical protein
MKRVIWSVLVAATVLAVLALLLVTLSGAPCPATANALVEPTVTYCPIPTPELFLVDPVISTTDRLSQVVTVYLGNGEAVTVTAESGTFAATGAFDAYTHPALVEVALLPGGLHRLRVFGKVRVIEHDGCIYGGYTLSTQRDRFGNPLVIRQTAILSFSFYLPLAFVDYSSPAPCVR